MREITVGLIGNPNVGKSVIFNNLTGMQQHVGNWPGKTVKKKVGYFTYQGVKIKIVDLPGTYSLTSRSVDERIARNYIIEQRPDVVVDIVNAAELERNLYLTILLLELGANLVVVLNKFDIARKQGYEIKIEQLSKLLGGPVIPTVATKGKGMRDLREMILTAANERTKHTKIIDYGESIERLIGTLNKILQKEQNLAAKYPLRWLSIKLLEGDQEIQKKVRQSSHSKEILEVLPSDS